MSGKRKDHKGRLLRTGESQRKDLTYQYRYTDVTGKRRTFYAKDLKDLRKLEENIQREIDAGVSYCEGNINIIELVPTNHTSCPAAHLLHQHGKCRNGSKKSAIPDGTI